MGKYYYQMVAEKLQPCYLDAKLQIVSDKSQAEAILNAHHGTRLQVLFLQPIAHDLLRNTAWLLGQKWIKKFFPRYYYPGEIPFPTYDTCVVANEGQTSLQITGCMTSTEHNDAYGRRIGWICLDEQGKPALGNDKTIVRNVYVSLFIELDEFKKLNPDFDLGKYLYRWYKNS